MGYYGELIFQHRSGPASDLMRVTGLLLDEKVTGTFCRSHPGMLLAWGRGEGSQIHASLGHGSTETGFEPWGLFPILSRTSVTSVTQRWTMLKLCRLKQHRWACPSLAISMRSHSAWVFFPSRGSKEGCAHVPKFFRAVWRDACAELKLKLLGDGGED